MHPGIFFLSLSPAADPPVTPADEKDCYEGNGSSYWSITSETISAPLEMRTAGIGEGGIYSLRS